MVKAVALNLQGGFAPDAVLFAEVKLGVQFAFGKADAVFVLEVFRFHRIQHPCFLQDVHAQGQQAFADDEAREMLLFYHADFKAFSV